MAAKKKNVKAKSLFVVECDAWESNYDYEKGVDIFSKPKGKQKVQYLTDEFDLYVADELDQAVTFSDAKGAEKAIKETFPQPKKKDDPKNFAITIAKPRVVEFCRKPTKKKK